ncbi:MAG: anti-sigma factor [Acidobacteriaceae bacterium]
MKNQDEFEARLTAPAGKSGGVSSGQIDCAAVERLWTEAAEGVLTDVVAEQLRAHTAECASCREKIGLARSGREWLLVLKQEPLVPPSDLVAKILAKTTGAPEAATHLPVPVTPSVPAAVRVRHETPPRLFGRSSAQSQSASIAADAAERTGDHERRVSDEGPSVASPPVWQHTSVVLLRRTVLEPRLALVAAMAFFSISLTLNLMGVRLTNLHAADLEPQSMRRAVTRQYAEANARVVRYYENLRIVYEVESRVHQLRQATETSPQPTQTGGKPSKRSSNFSRDSSNDQTESHREGLAANPEAQGKKHGMRPEPKPVITGPRLDAAFHLPAWRSRSINSRMDDASIDPTFAQPERALFALHFPFRLAPQAVACVPTPICFSMRRFSTRERRLA